jgi:hypothetical protein
MVKGLFLLSLVLLTSCVAPPLAVRTEKIDHKFLASSHAETPDPLRCRFFRGQQLVLSWKLCKKKVKAPLHLRLLLVRANHSLEVIERTLSCLSGTTVFYFLGDNYCSKGEILTWRAELYQGSRLVALACQKPWVDWIDDSK